MIEVSLPAWAAWLDEEAAQDAKPVRHRVLHGGRGGGKSWTVACKLVEKAWLRPLRILCTREFQNSIRDSSKKLIEDWIDKLGLGPGGSGFFKITENEIRGQNGSVFSFMGLHGKEGAIKSLEGYDLVWVEEAATVSRASIDALIPTIRKEGSELWWTYNPRFPTDPVDDIFRGERGPPPGSIVVEVNWNDNKWFPEVLLRDMEFDRERDPEKYAHVWLGQYLVRSEALIFDRWKVAPFEAPADAIFRFGADWGYAQDPTVLVRCFIGRWAGEPYESDVIADPEGTYLFVDHEAYKVRCEIEEAPALFAGHDLSPKERWQNPFHHHGVPGALSYPIIADSQRQDTISYMVSRGFNMHPAKKGPGSVEDGISFLKNYDIVVHPRCRHLADELAMYSWQTDRLTGLIIPRPVDRNNHVIDSLRYACEGVRKVPTQDTRFASAGPRVFASIGRQDPMARFRKPW